MASVQVKFIAHCSECGGTKFEVDKTQHLWWQNIKCVQCDEDFDQSDLDLEIDELG